MMIIIVHNNKNMYNLSLILALSLIESVKYNIEKKKDKTNNLPF